MMSYSQRFIFLIICIVLSLLFAPKDDIKALNDRILHVGAVDNGEIATEVGALRYMLDTGRYDTITLRFMALELEVNLHDAAGAHLIPLQTAEGAMGFVHSYRLSGNEPYCLELVGSGDYSVQMLAGDHVRRQAGDLAPDQEVYGRPRGDGTHFMHYLDVPEDGTFTLTVMSDGLSLPDIHVVDEGDQVYQPALQNFDHDNLALVYQVPGDQSYQIALEGSEGYSISMAAGDTISITGADLNFGQIIQDRVPPGHIVSHLLPGSQGDMITVYNAATDDADQINWEIFNPDAFDPLVGNALPYRLVRAVRMGHGEAVVLEFEQPGRYLMRMINITNNPDLATSYALAAADGDVIELDGGRITPGQKVTIQNDTVGLRVAFTLATDAGDRIRVQGQALIDPSPEDIILSENTASFVADDSVAAYHLIVDIQDRIDYTLAVTSETSTTITEQRTISTDGYGLSAFEGLQIQSAP